MLLDHLDGILNYCRIKIPLGVVEAVNGNIKALLRRGRGYRDLNYLLLKAQRLAVTKTEFVAFRKAAKHHASTCQSLPLGNLSVCQTSRSDQFRESDA